MHVQYELEAEKFKSFASVQCYLIKPGYIIDEGLTINVIQAPTDQCPCDLRLYSY